MTEQQRYEVLARLPDVEIRRYPVHLVAEVEVDASFSDAGTRAFGMLVSYISGRNTARSKVAMTAPVLQQPAAERIAMTSPVLQRAGTEPGRHTVAFVMPADYSLETLPSPADPRVSLREVPAEVAAARSFSGRWTSTAYEQNLAELLVAVRAAGYTVAGPPRFARFDPPWTPWFLRRNEVVVPVGGGPDSAGSPD